MAVRENCQRTWASSYVRAPRGLAFRRCEGTGTAHDVLEMWLAVTWRLTWHDSTRHDDATSG